MRLAWLCSLLLAACNSDTFNGDAGDAADESDGGIPVNEGGSLDGSDSNTDAGRPTHRIFAINSDLTGGVHSIVAWDDADIVAGDRKPDVAIGGLTKAQAVTLAGDRLFVFDDGAGVLKAFDKAGTLTSSSTESASLGSSAFIGAPTPHLQQLLWKSSGDFLITTDGNTSAVHLFANATTLKTGDMAKARFGSLNEGFGGAVIDGTDRLFVGEIPQQVIKFATGASTKTGATSLTMDFASTGFIIQSMVADAARLYAGGLQNGNPVIAVYELVSIQPGAQPSFTLQLGNNGTVTDLEIANDTLVACVAAAKSGGFIFKGAKSLSSSSQGVALTIDPHQPLRAQISAKTGLIYTVGSYKGNPGVQVWKNETTPTLQAELRTGIGPQPYGLALYEP